MIDQYFQRKRLNLSIDSAHFSSLQKMRSLYLLSGKTLPEIPTITEFINGMLYFLSINLERDLTNVKKDKREPLILGYIQRHFSNINIEKELDKDEYDDFRNAFTDVIVNINFPSIFPEAKEDIMINTTENMRLTSYGSQQINMVLEDEEVFIARKINFLLNEINKKTYLYSIPDIIRAGIDLITMTSLKVSFIEETYIPHLYGIPFEQYFRFDKRYFLNPGSVISPDYRNILSVIIDKPIVDKLEPVIHKIADFKSNNPRKMRDLLNQIDMELKTDDLWSYVTNFNYKKAMKGFGYIRLSLIVDLDINELVDYSYNSMFDMIFKETKNITNSDRIILFGYLTFLSKLSTFFYMVSNSVNQKA